MSALAPEEKQIILQRRSATNRIAFALQIGFLKMTGRSINSVELVPSAVPPEHDLPKYIGKLRATAAQRPPLLGAPPLLGINERVTIAGVNNELTSPRNLLS